MTWASFLWLEIQRAQNKYVPVGAVSERCERCHWICFSHAIRADTIKNCRKNCLFSHEFMKWTSLARDSKSPKWFRPVKALSELCHWICCSHEIRADTIKNEGPVNALSELCLWIRDFPVRYKARRSRLSGAPRENPTMHSEEGGEWILHWFFLQTLRQRHLSVVEDCWFPLRHR